MAREVDLYNIGDSNDDLKRALLALRQDFDSHIHDGTISRAFQNLFVESISSLGSLSVRKRNFSDNTAGFWTGISNNIAKLFLGDGTNSLKWDGTTLTITGTITATAGTIGGFTIGATTISATNLTLTSGASNTAHILVGTGSTAGGLNSAGASGDITIWSGSAHSGRATAPFRVTAAGALVATNATITGTITSTSGTIGGWTIGSTTITGGGITLDSTGIITGGTIRTASSGARVEMLAASNDIRIYDASVLRATLGGTGLSLYNTVGNLSATFLADSGGATAIDVSSYPGSGGAMNLTGAFSASNYITSGNDLVFGVNQATGRLQWDNAGAGTIIQPIIYFGYCSGTTISRDNNSFTLTNPSTGNYTITHNLNSSTYTVVATALRASGAGAYIAKIAALNVNSFDVIVFDDTGTAVNGDFMFLLTQA